MTREIRFNAFDMNCVGHQSPGLWAHPRDRSWQYKDLEYWVELAEILERGKFDGLFIADVLGVYDVYNSNLDAALRNSTQIPVNDPLQLVPAMALVTKHLGFGLTASLSFEHPYTFVRRLSTLDHLTKGRAGWNIVTSYLDSGTKNIGLGGQSAHDDRYDVADEYMEVCYKLWEGSWEDDAVLRDRARRIFTDPAKVHPIHHEGRYVKVPGVHLSEPSPQRTPVLYQAGASARERSFAGEHAECVFIATPSKAVLEKSVAAIRESVAAAGRDPRSVLIFNLQTGSSMRRTPRQRRNTRTTNNIAISTARWRWGPDGWGSTSATTGPMSRCATSRPTLCNPPSKRFPAQTPTKCGLCANSPNGSASEVSGRCLWAALRPSPICSRNGSRIPTWTASISPMP
jgi:long-chain alkane monooxygenase